MISNNIYFFIRIMSPIAAFFGRAPSTWNPKTRLFAPSPHSRRCTRYNCLLIFSWVIFSIFQLIRFYKTGDVWKINFVAISSILACIISLEAFAIMTFNEHEGRTMANTILLYLPQVNGISKKNTLEKFQPQQSYITPD